MSRVYPCIDRDLLHHIFKFIVLNAVQFGSGEGKVPFTENSEFPGNSRGRDLMVSSDHYGLDASTRTGPDCDLRLFPWRVSHPHKPHKDHFGLYLLKGDFFFKTTVSNSDNPESLIPHVPNDIKDFLPEFGS